jgi:hypothetical protein
MLLSEFREPTALCATTTEVFDNGTGRAGIIIINSHPIR